MYADYWQLIAKPFEPAPTGASFFASEAHEGALLKLRYAVEERLPCAALAGPAGVGKTLLVRRLCEQLGPGAGPVVRVVYPDLPPQELLATLADGLAAEPATAPGLAGQVGRLARALASLAARGGHALVVVDDAQALEDAGLMETVRLLLNLAEEAGRSLTLLLAGQMGLLSALGRSATLEERVAVKSLLRTFVPHETAAYVNHRLRAAGAQREVFTAGALESIHRLSGGVPRRVDRLCDLALLVGYADGLTEVGADRVESVSRELLCVAPE